jgi:hypothetical protein
MCGLEESEVEEADGMTGVEAPADPASRGKGSPSSSRSEEETISCISDTCVTWVLTLTCINDQLYASHTVGYTHLVCLHQSISINRFRVAVIIIRTSSSRHRMPMPKPF